MRRGRQMFSGRYGVDTYSHVLSGVAIVLLIVSLFFRWKTLTILAGAIAGYNLFRVFSKNITRRSYENAKFLRSVNGLRSWFRCVFGTKGYRYFRCESCRTEMRVPKRQGKIRIKCPRCGKESIRRT